MPSRSASCMIRYASRGHGLFPSNLCNSSRVIPNFAATNAGATSLSNDPMSRGMLGEGEFMRLIDVDERYVHRIPDRIGILFGGRIEAVDAFLGRDQCRRTKAPPLRNRQEERPPR